MFFVHLLAIAHLAAGDPGSQVLKGAAKAAPEVCAELGRTGPRPFEGRGRPASEDTAATFAAIDAMKPVGGVADPTALGLLGMLADLTASQGYEGSQESAAMIRKLAPGATDPANRSRAAEALGCSGAQRDD
jgi:hypothetical protein